MALLDDLMDSGFPNPSWATLSSIFRTSRRVPLWILRPVPNFLRYHFQLQIAALNFTRFFWNGKFTNCDAFRRAESVEGTSGRPNFLQNHMEKQEIDGYTP